MTIVKQQPLRQRLLKPSSTTLRKDLLVCGILSSLLYVATDVIGTLLYEGYSYADNTWSELFAIGAPTRPLIAPYSIAATLLTAAFAVGLWSLWLLRNAPPRASPQPCCWDPRPSV
jgi:lysylphosphatidylglycerol synthetase-like protein (DUF2156 family)